MNYFVTGATGFIGRNLIARLLQRDGTIYALVRSGSRGRLEELRTSFGADGARIVPVAGDLTQPGLGVAEEDMVAMRGEVDHFFHLAAIYDITASAEAQEAANVEGTRHAVELAGAIEAGIFHHVSSIAAAGLYRGEWREDMFDEAERLDTNPYFRTKHESERLVREECPRPWRVYRPGIVVGDSRTGEIDKIDGPYYFFKTPHRPGAEDRRRGGQPLCQGGQRTADGAAARRRGDRAGDRVCPLGAGPGPGREAGDEAGDRPARPAR